METLKEQVPTLQAPRAPLCEPVRDSQVGSLPCQLLDERLWKLNPLLQAHCLNLQWTGDLPGAFQPLLQNAVRRLASARVPVQSPMRCLLMTSLPCPPWDGLGQKANTGPSRLEPELPARCREAVEWERQPRGWRMAGVRKCIAGWWQGPDHACAGLLSS